MVRAPSAIAYRNVAKRLQGEEVPLPDPTKQRRGLQAKVRQLMQTKLF